MPVRKSKRTRRPALETAAEYEVAWNHAKYFESGGKYLTRDAFHADRFDDEAALRIFYEANRAGFAALPLIVGGRICRAGCRHPLWWRFDSPEPRDEGWPEVAQLHAMRLLAPDEITALRQEAVAEDKQLHFAPWHNGLPFRRSAIFWMFIAIEPRDESIYEAAQLTRMCVLTKLEKEIIAEPLRAVGLRQPPILPNRTRFYYLAKAERVLLGIDGGHEQR
jgi:hypothetical protein